MIRYQDSLMDNTLPFGKALIKCFHLTEDSFPSLFTQKDASWNLYIPQIKTIKFKKIYHYNYVVKI